LRRRLVIQATLSQKLVIDDAAFRQTKGNVGKGTNGVDTRKSVLVAEKAVCSPLFAGIDCPPGSRSIIFSNSQF